MRFWKDYSTKKQLFRYKQILLIITRKKTILSERKRGFSSGNFYSSSLSQRYLARRNRPGKKSRTEATLSLRNPHNDSSYNVYISPINRHPQSREQRNPTLLFPLSGSFLLRFDARKLFGLLLFQLPPRTTREDIFLGHSPLTKTKKGIILFRRL